MPEVHVAPAKRPTIRDVAALAGVSKSLASRAFTDPDRVSEASMGTILRAAEKLGYRPSWSARALNSSNGGFTGIVIADLFSPAFAPIVVGAYRRLGAAGRETLMSVASLSEPGVGNALEDAAVAFLGDLRPDSLLIVGAVRDMSLLEPLAATIPTVVAGARPTNLPTATRVFTDDGTGLRLAVEHLVELGHRNIAHVSGIGRVGEARARAYVEAMSHFGLQQEVRIEQADFEEEGGYAATRRLLMGSPTPTAITTAGDHAAVGALGALRDVGRADISVVGYGDAPVARFNLVRLSTVSPDNEAIGVAAANSLLRSGSSERRGTDVRVPPALVVRQSTRPPALHF